MKNRLVGVVMGQVIGLVIVCVFSGFFALVSFGGVAGVVIGSKPIETLLFTAPYVCTEGTVNSEEWTASYNRPGETNFLLECVHADGTTEDITVKTIGVSLLGFYLACFLPLCIPGGLVAMIVPLFFLRRKKHDTLQAQPPSAIESL